MNTIDLIETSIDSGTNTHENKNKALLGPVKETHLNIQASTNEADDDMFSDCIYM